MINAPANDSAYTNDFATVQSDENDWLERRRQAADLPPPNDDIVGLAFSGGGIRSATFNLGVLQALQAAGLMRHMDYLSSVSGGGYVASCYTWLRARLAAIPPGGVFGAPLVAGTGRVLDWLRGHGKFLISHRGFSLWTLVASILAATFVNVLVLGPPLVFTIYGMTLDWLPVTWPDWLLLPGGHVPRGHHGYWLLLVAGTLCLLAFPLVATVFALLAGIPRVSDVRRIDALRVFMGRLIAFGPALIAVGLIPIAATLGEMVEHFFTGHRAFEVGKHASYLAPIISGVASMVFDRRRSGNNNGRLTMIGLSLVVYGLLILCYHIAAHVDHHLHAPLYVGLIALSVLLAFVCDINRVSIHAYYRARLSDAFLPEVGTGGTADPGEFALSEVAPEKGAPLPLINTTLNTTSSRDELLRSRQGASFTFSPLYTGSAATGYRRVGNYAGGSMTLSNAFTISGAAIDPDMYVTRARAVSFLMALLNVRLGYWGRNPRCGHERDPWRPWWWVFIAREMLGTGLDETRRHVHLSDGGGFENLGIYELVRRRVRYVIVTDAGADPQTTLADLGRAIERVRVDFGAEIDLSADRLYHQRDENLMRQPCALGRIRYADGSAGQILYIKPVLCADLTADVYAYWRDHPAFPDEPTSEQFFGEAQFEAYRALGRQVVTMLLGADTPATVSDWFARLQAMRDGTPRP